MNLRVAKMVFIMLVYVPLAFSSGLAVYGVYSQHKGTPAKNSVAVDKPCHMDTGRCCSYI